MSRAVPAGRPRSTGIAEPVVCRIGVTWIAVTDWSTGTAQHAQRTHKPGHRFGVSFVSETAHGSGTTKAMTPLASAINKARIAKRKQRRTGSFYTTVPCYRSMGNGALQTRRQRPAFRSNQEIGGGGGGFLMRHRAMTTAIAAMRATTLRMFKIPLLNHLAWRRPRKPPLR